MVEISLIKSSLLVKIIFFVTYPAMSVFFYVVGFGASWNPLTVIGAVALMFATSQIMGKPMDLQSPNLHSIRILMLVTVVCSLFTSNDPGLGVFLGLMPVIIVFYLLIKLQRFEILVDPKDERVFALYWFIYVISASIPTSMGLAELKYTVNFIPVFLIGTILGWLGPEVTYRIIGGVYGAVKALALTFVFLMIFVLLYGLIFGDIFPTMNYLVPDGPKVFLISFTALPSMLLSRITMEFFKTYGGLDF